MNKLLVKSIDFKPGDIVVKVIDKLTFNFEDEPFDRIIQTVDSEAFTYIKFSGLSHKHFEYRIEHAGASPWYEVYRV